MVAKIPAPLCPMHLSEGLGGRQREGEGEIAVGKPAVTSVYIYMLNTQSCSKIHTEMEGLCLQGNTKRAASQSRTRGINAECGGGEAVVLSLQMESFGWNVSAAAW